MRARLYPPPPLPWPAAGEPWPYLPAAVALATRVRRRLSKLLPERPSSAPARSSCGNFFFTLVRERFPRRASTPSHSRSSCSIISQLIPRCVPPELHRPSSSAPARPSREAICPGFSCACESDQKTSLKLG